MWRLIGILLVVWLVITVVGITTTSSAADLLGAGAHRTVADLADPWLVAFASGGG